MKIFSKKDIKNMIIGESKTTKIFEKKDLCLIEDDSNAYVEPSSDNSSSLAADLNKTKQKNPTDDTFIVNANSYDGNKTNNTITLDINGENARDATQKFQQLQKRPQVRNLMANTNVNAKIHLKNEHVERLKEHTVTFNKKEIREMLKK
jgi:GTPase SAR1 family protein